MKLPGQWLVLLLCAACGSGWGQTPQRVCNRGTGHFETRFSTGVTVRVGAVANGGFATRACEAELRWGSHRVVVVPTAAQVDIDVLGADLGFGGPVVAFVVRPAPEDELASYEIWSIERRPHLLRTLTGGDSYRAVDAEFNGQVAIWTTDAAAVEDFDGLRSADMSPPTVVLRFEHGRLEDVSALYREQYDHQIDALRGNLTAEAVAKFRMSDGQLKFGSLPSAEWLRLRKTKTVVLEIVWAYLYRGRPDRAWAELQAAWPGGDVARVKAAILAARSRGIETQVAKVVSATRSPKWMERPAVYEYLKPIADQGQTNGRLTYGAPGLAGPGPVLVEDHISSSIGMFEADTEPQPISLWRPPPSAAEQALAHEQEAVSLTIDEAGKVESAKMLVPGSDPELLEAAKDWKFVPASRDGKPVAYKLRMDVRPLQ